jgi:hypothetical protein
VQLRLSLILFTPSGHPTKGAATNKHSFPHPSFAMASYAYSVLNHWFGTVHSKSGSEPSVIRWRSRLWSVTPKDVNDALLSQETTYSQRRSTD